MTDETLKELQRTQKEMLFDIVDVCEKNNIKYYLGCGTLLGAVRHKGFIPWDDDIDILMPWDDYKKFLTIAQHYLGDDYFVQDNYTDSNWYRAYATVRKNNTTMMYPQHTKYLAHQGIWLDIFPLANIGSDFELFVKRQVLRLCNYIIMDEYIHANEDEFKSKLGRVGMKLFSLLYKIPKENRQQVRKNMIEYIMAGGTHKRKYIAEVWCGITDAFPYKCFEGGNDSTVEFCGRNLKAMSDWDLYLRTEYGENYMTPLKVDKNHEELIIDFDKSYIEYLEL